MMCSPWFEPATRKIPARFHTLMEEVDAILVGSRRLVVFPDICFPSAFNLISSAFNLISLCNLLQDPCSRGFCPLNSFGVFETVFSYQLKKTNNTKYKKKSGFLQGLALTASSLQLQFDVGRKRAVRFLEKFSKHAKVRNIIIIFGLRSAKAY